MKYLFFTVGVERRGRGWSGTRWKALEEGGRGMGLWVSLMVKYHIQGGNSDILP
jgi:hypothetical protein